MAEPVMMKLAEKGIGRQDAHEIVREASMCAVMDDVDLRDALLERDDIKAVMTREEVISIMDPANYTGASGAIVDKMVSAAEELLGRKV